jgi:hypothetical protein
VSATRPWRAAAYWPMHPGRLYLASASAKTRAGLRRFEERHRGEGAVVDVWQVQPIPEVERLAQVADSSAG